MFLSIKVFVTKSSILSEPEDIAVSLISQCKEYITIEGICSSAIFDEELVVKSLCQLENSLINSCTSGIADGMFYMATFLIADK